MTLTATDLAGWTPVRVAPRQGRLAVDWCHTDGIHFDDPFFDQTVERCFRHPFRLLFTAETTVDQLVERSRRHPGLAPAGLVFHGSRCGSTLVAQMLGRVPTTLSLSGPGPVDSILRAPSLLPGVTAADQVDWLRAVVSALTQPRRPEHRLAVVKLDAWAVLYLPLVRAAFPGVPWAFVYRDPVEVLVSHIGRRGFHMVPGTLPAPALGLAEGEAEALAPEEFVAHVLGRLYEAGLAGHEPGRSLLVNHRDLPGAVGAIAVHFGVDVDATGRAAMEDAAGRDAKNPAFPYTDDRAAKRAAASPALIDAVARRVAPAYQALERARVAGERP